MMMSAQNTGRKEFPLVLKADVQGSAEAIAHALNELGNEEVGARILQSGVGGITESDITLASASNAPILGFNVRANKQAREAAARDGIEIRYYNVIYDLVDDIKAAMSGLLSPGTSRDLPGQCRDQGNLPYFQGRQGCRLPGHRRCGRTRCQCAPHSRRCGDSRRRTGNAQALQGRVKSVESGQECGMNFVKYQDMRPGDIIECFRVEQIARTL